MLRQNIGLKYGAYGIVLWTKHDDKADEFKNRIRNDYSQYTLPLFIISLDKAKYMKDGNYNPLFTDLDNKLKENVAASFFII